MQKRANMVSLEVERQHGKGCGKTGDTAARTLVAPVEIRTGPVTNETDVFA